jgi:hypothetical protein
MEIYHYSNTSDLVKWIWYYNLNYEKKEIVRQEHPDLKTHITGMYRHINFRFHGQCRKSSQVMQINNTTSQKSYLFNMAI